MNLSALPDLRAAQAPDAPAIADDTINLNNTQFADAVRRASVALRERGISAGDVVAIKLPNRADFVVAMFAAWRLGAAVTPISPTLVPAEAAYQIEDAAAKVLVVDAPLEIDAPVEVLSTYELTAGQAPRFEPAEHRDDALALLIYTSGTTGRPKGVMLDHANLNAMCRMAIDAFKMTSDDHSLLILPLFHANGIVVGTLSPLVAGGRATIAGRFSPKTFFGRLEQCGATYFSAVPTIYTMLRPARRGAPRHVVEIRRLWRRTGKRRAADQVRDPLRHPAHRGLRIVRRHVRQHRQPARRRAQTRHRRPSVAGPEDSDRRPRQRRRSAG